VAIAIANRGFDRVLHLRYAATQVGNRVQHRRKSALKALRDRSRRLASKGIRRTRWQPSAYCFCRSSGMVDEHSPRPDKRTSAADQCKILLSMVAAMPHWIQKLWIKATQSGQLLRVAPVVFTVALCYETHAPGIRDDHLMPQRSQQPANPGRMGADLDNDATRGRGAEVAG
jgi:hypothetical protein